MKAYLKDKLLFGNASSAEQISYGSGTVKDALDGMIVVENKLVTTSGSIASGSQQEVDCTSAYYQKDGYTLELCIPICYSGAIVGTNYEAKRVAFKNVSTSTASGLRLEVRCLYRKNP